MEESTLKGPVNGKKDLLSALRKLESGGAQVGLYTTLRIHGKDLSATILAQVEDSSFALSTNHNTGTNHPVGLGRQQGDTGRGVGDGFQDEPAILFDAGTQLNKLLPSLLLGEVFRVVDETIPSLEKATFWSRTRRKAGFDPLNLLQSVESLFTKKCVSTEHTQSLERGRLPICIQPRKMLTVCKSRLGTNGGGIGSDPPGPVLL